MIVVTPVLEDEDKLIKSLEVKIEDSIMMTTQDLLIFMQSFRVSMEENGKKMEEKIELTKASMEEKIEATNSKIDKRLDNIDDKIKDMNDKMVENEECTKRMDARLLDLEKEMQRLTGIRKRSEDLKRKETELMNQPLRRFDPLGKLKTKQKNWMDLVQLT